MSREDPLLLDVDGRITKDVVCGRCGYNLRGLRAVGVCSECGWRVIDSINKWTNRPPFPFGRQALLACLTGYAIFGLGAGVQIFISESLGGLTMATGVLAVCVSFAMSILSLFGVSNANRRQKIEVFFALVLSGVPFALIVAGILLLFVYGIPCRGAVLRLLTVWRCAGISDRRSLPLDGQGRIDADVVCVFCGYNLRGLAIDGVCSECGKGMGPSIQRWTESTALKPGQLAMGMNIAGYAAFAFAYVLYLLGATGQSLDAGCAILGAIALLFAFLWSVVEMFQVDKRERRDRLRVHCSLLMSGFAITWMIVGLVAFAIKYEIL